MAAEAARLEAQESWCFADDVETVVKPSHEVASELKAETAKKLGVEALEELKVGGLLWLPENKVRCDAKAAEEKKAGLFFLPRGWYRVLTAKPEKAEKTAEENNEEESPEQQEAAPAEAAAPEDAAAAPEAAAPEAATEAAAPEAAATEAATWAAAPGAAATSGEEQASGEEQKEKPPPPLVLYGLRRVRRNDGTNVVELGPSEGTITAAHLRTLPLFEAILDRMPAPAAAAAAAVPGNAPKVGVNIWGMILAHLLPPNSLGAFTFDFDKGILALVTSCRGLAKSLSMHPFWILQVLGLGSGHLGAVLGRPGVTCAGVAKYICKNAARLPDVIRKDPGFREILFPQTRHDIGEKQAQALAPSGPGPEPKLRAVQLLGTFLLGEPAYRGDTDKDPVSAELVALCGSIAKEDPQFVLKLAYYVRSVLTFRNTTNFLLATAVQIEPCKAFVRTALPKCTNLPTDLLELWDFWRKLSGTVALPACMKKGMCDKFSEFSEYQLGKYLNAKVPKPQPAPASQAASGGKGKGKGRGRGRGSALDRKSPEDAAKEAKEAEERMKDPLKRPLTLKTLIRSVHAGAGKNQEVCGVLRKRYPMTQEEFEDMHLDAGGSKEFDPAQAGAKMRIAIPETWETKLSEVGNTPDAWQDLVLSKKLPFMAMLKNLRNIILAGVSEKTHSMILGRLKSKQQVAGCKQQPTRFLSAFEAIDFDEAALAKLDEEAKGEDDFVEETKAVGSGKEAKQITKKRRVCRNPPTKELLDKYRNALEVAVTLAAQNNMPPMESPTGKTVVLVDVSGSMEAPLMVGAKKLHEEAMVPHRRSSGRPIVEGQDFDLEDYFSQAGQRSSKKLSVSMIWIGNDLDLSVMVLNKEGKEIGKCSYTSLTWQGLSHSGDIRSAPNGAEEIITVDLDNLPPEAFMLMFTVNVYSGETLDKLEEAAISLRDDGLVGDSVEGTQEICAFRLTGTVKAIIVGSLMRKDTGWAFRCLNTPQAQGMTVNDLSAKMHREYQAAMADSATQQKRLVDAALLLALCLRECMGEDKVEICLFSAPGKEGAPGHKVLRGLGPKVLANVRRCQAVARQMGRGTIMPIDYLQELTASQVPIDHLVLLSDGLVSPAKSPADALPRWLAAHRAAVKPMRFVSIDMLGLGKAAVGEGSSVEDVLISGWSEAALRYLTQEPGAQLKEVEAIELPPPKEPSSKEAEKEG